MVIEEVQCECTITWIHTDGLVQERRNSIANAPELRLSCTNSSCRYERDLKLVLDLARNDWQSVNQSVHTMVWTKTGLTFKGKIWINKKLSAFFKGIILIFSTSMIQYNSVSLTSTNLSRRTRSHTCQVTLNITGSPHEKRWGSRKYPG